MGIGGNGRLQRILSSMHPTADHTAEGPSSSLHSIAFSPLGLLQRMGYCPLRKYVRAGVGLRVRVGRGEGSGRKRALGSDRWH